MPISSTINSIQQVTNSYKTFLSGITEEEFQMKPSSNAWSYSEIYFHIFDASILSTKAIRSIDTGRDEGGRLTFIGWAVLFFGAFPPSVRLKAPKNILARVKSISKEEALRLIESFETKLTFVANITTNIDLISRVKHSRLGALNRNDWFKFIDVHLKHHLKQVERNRKAFLKIK